jgi:hypothetical protein
MCPKTKNSGKISKIPAPPKKRLFLGGYFILMSFSTSLPQHDYATVVPREGSAKPSKSNQILSVWDVTPVLKKKKIF